MDLHNKQILVVGATGGIGNVCSKALDAEGAQLFLTGRNVEKLKLLEQALAGRETHSMPCDLTQVEEIEALVNACPILDGLIFSAGIIQPQPIKYIRSKHIRTIFQINFEAAVLLISSLFRAKKINDQASLVFISSISSKFAHKGGALYAGSKAALNSFSKTIAIEFAHRKIRSNVISAAMVKSDIFDQAVRAVSAEKMAAHEQQYPLGFGLGQDVAHACNYLLSDASRWTTGTEIVLDGGLTAGH